MIDAIEVTDTIMKERIQAGSTGLAAFHIHIPLLTDWGKKRDTDMRKYFLQNGKKQDYSPMTKHIAKYKKMKLEGETSRLI